MAGTKRSHECVVASMTVALLGVALPSFSSESPNLYDVWNPPTLHLLWNDAYRLFPEQGFKAMREEVEGLFAASDISVRVHRAALGTSLDELPDPAVNAVLLPVEAERWNLDRMAMAVAHGEPGKKRTIFIFFPSVKRTLGIKGSKIAPGDAHGLALATGRIVAHELVHVLAPERGHSEDGLMAPRLTRKNLLKKAVALDATSRDLARRKVELWAGTKRVADTGRVRVAY